MMKRIHWKRTRHAATGLAATLLLGMGCTSAEDSSDGASGACVPGEQRSCPCGVGLADSVQICNASGTLDACQCSGDSTTDPLGTTTGTTTGTVTGTTTGTVTGTTTGTTTGVATPDPCIVIYDMVCDVETEALGEPPMLNDDSVRQGPWYTDADTGSITGSNDLDVAIADGSCGSTRAIHATGSGTGNGSVLGFHFNASEGSHTTYDLNGVTRGIAFFAKGSGTVRFELMTDALDGTKQGSCSGDQCFGYHGVDLTLSDEWQLHQISFSDVEQPDWSSDVQEVSLDLGDAVGVQFKMTGSAFDVWLDDLGFF